MMFCRGQTRSAVGAAIFLAMQGLVTATAIAATPKVSPASTQPDTSPAMSEVVIAAGKSSPMNSFFGLYRSDDCGSKNCRCGAG